MGCGIASHSKNHPTDPISPGIYVRCARTGVNREKVLLSPVRDVLLMSRHAAAILSEEDVTANNWVAKFSMWKKFASSQEAADARSFQEAAKAAQTPAKRKTSVQEISSLIDEDPMDILGVDMDTALTIYEEVWAAAAESAKISKDETHHLKELLLSSTTRLNQLTQAVKGLSTELTGVEMWSTAGIDQASLRVTDLEKRLGVPLGSYSTVWAAVSDLSASAEQAELKLQDSTAKFSLVDNEFSQMFSGVTKFQNDVNSAIASINTKLNALSSGSQPVTLGGPHLLAESQSATSPSSSSLTADLQAELTQLCKDRAADQSRIESLESRLETGSDKVEVQTDDGKSMLLRSSVDVLAYLEAIRALDVDFGGFADVYNFFLRIHVKCTGEGDLEKVVKLKKDVQSLQISENEAFAIHTHSSILPAIFNSGKATKKSEIGPLQAFKSWRIKGTQFGLAYSIEKYLPLVEKDVRAIIDHEYGNFPELKNKAREMAMESKACINVIISWVDDTHTELIDAGNPPDNVWWIITWVL